MWGRWYVEGPHVYNLTFISSSGVNGSTFLVRVLYKQSNGWLLFLEFFQDSQRFFDMFFWLELRREHVPNHAFLIDYERHPPRDYSHRCRYAVELPNLPVRITQQQERQPVVSGERLVRFHTLRT